MANFKVLVNSEGDVVNKVFAGIDTTNVIATLSSFKGPYTVQQDCCAYIKANWTMTLLVNNVELAYFYTGSENYHSGFLPLKKNDVIKNTSDGVQDTVTLFGLKY